MLLSQGYSCLAAAVVAWWKTGSTDQLTSKRMSNLRHGDIHTTSEERWDDGEATRDVRLGSNANLTGVKKVLLKSLCDILLPNPQH
jgi:hypothetical protein